MTTPQIDHRSLYRLPWSLPDNAICWLEPTSSCNLHCDGCYRQDNEGHKKLSDICRELDVFQRLRTSDCISIAGGDPLVYPEIVPLVAEIKRRGLKPILNTNGLALTPDLLKDLKKAGLFGFTFHVDSNQGRPGKWAGKNELELNDLRLEFAELTASAGDIACSFNATVYDENQRFLPGMLQWAREHIDIVQTMVFICFRHVIPGNNFDWMAGSRKVDWQSLWYHSDDKRRIDIGVRECIALAREHDPDFSPAAYLNGTEDPTALKWLLTARIGTRSQTFGYVGPKFIELLMGAYHFSTGKYLSYASPASTRRGRATALLLWPFDAGIRRITKSYLKTLARNPFRIFKRTHLQTIMIIQPVDCMPDGRQSMCDSCPDVTVWNDRLVWSCRLEEMKTFGTFLLTVPKEDQRL